MADRLRTHREIVERMPPALRSRPRDKRGYPVPWFTPKVDGEWDFRVVAPGKVEEAAHGSLCWTCGGRLEIPCAFVVGPMCAVNRTSAEPPSHVECAIYAARACPFLARPKMERPSGHSGVYEGENMPGVALMRNPGVALVWTTKRPVYRMAIKLFDIGDPERVVWFAHSRKATRAEILESIETGLPHLRKLAEDEGPEAIGELERRTATAMELLPA
jgi:hypothetical protein